MYYVAPSTPSERLNLVRYGLERESHHKTARN